MFYNGLNAGYLVELDKSIPTKINLIPICMKTGIRFASHKAVDNNKHVCVQYIVQLMMGLSMRPRLILEGCERFGKVPGIDKSVQQSHRCRRHLQEHPDSPADEQLPAGAPDGERERNSLVRICRRTEESNYQREAERTQ